MSGVTVTPTGVREGDPAALAALSALRGPSVVAYCRHVAGEADAGTAAAEAFAHFRVAVVDAGDTTSLNPEALLISATRTCAAAHASTTAQGDCARVPALLAARAAKTIAADDLERLASHLEQCSACRAPVARFSAAERAYRDPPEKTLDPALAAQIVGALIAAVPPTPAPEPAPVASNGGAAHAPVGDAHATADVPQDQPSEQLTASDALEPAIADGETAARTPREPAMAAVQREPPERSRRRMRLAYVLPIVLILLALITALYVAGVFGGNDPESSPSVAVPTAEPVDMTEPDLVVVPGAEDASADAVEKAKARARGDSEPGAAKKDTAKTDGANEAPAPAAGPAPPANGSAPRASPPPVGRAVSPNNPVTKPAPEPATRPNEEKQIDAGGGATGAEQIPPPADASEVPDLAPPPESATTP